ncbi:hypothetical protein LHK94_02540 [Dickeya zeae]|uniref:hypothetical protein n=1 Tax=Dickeya zeae TaxID=204042 RepID=UPI001CFA4742|nr:hypothetical protein [Dickeya zeae]UCZ75914.1 hypothetical protein LHK94_02540 [Dickeya zeae]
MSFFVQAASSALYLASTDGDNTGALAFVLGVNAPEAGKGIELFDALTNTRLAGTFIFCPQALNFNDDAEVQRAFVTAVQTVVARQAASRGILWISTADPTALAQSASPIWLGVAGDGTSVVSGLANANILPSMVLTIPNGMKISLADDVLTLSKGNVTFTGASAPKMTAASVATLPFAGANRGCIAFETAIQRASLYNSWYWGFHFLFTNSAAFDGLISEWLPLAAWSDGATDMLNFTANIDPANPLNAIVTLHNQNSNRSALLFGGTNRDGRPTRLNSFYVTVSGEGVTLTPVVDTQGGRCQPAGLVFAIGHRLSDSVTDFHAAPFGDFLISAPPGPNGVTAEILCGLSGSEFISITPGDAVDSASRLRFVSQQGAYAQAFPPPAASPTGAPGNSNILLTQDYVTSWATVLPAVGKQNTYAAQPDGAALFGYDDYVWQKNPRMLGHVDPGYVLPDNGTAPFPLVPYSGFLPGDGINRFNQQQSRQFETLIIGPTRRKAIGSAEMSQTLSTRQHTARRPSLAARATGGTVNFTTPSGVLASVASSSADSAWEKILLGQVVTPEPGELAFTHPSAELQQAFQTNQLFLVVANAQHLVRQDGVFSNQLNIGGWVVEADVGTSLDYGDYTNVMIVKNITGPLWDPNGNVDDNLVASPSKWTQADTFAAPTIGRDDTPDLQQMVNLSQWLQDYFTAAFAQEDAVFFGDFCRIAADPNWTGILILRAKIATVPNDLAGITAGIRNPDRFYAHHLAVQISQIKSEPAGAGILIDKQSSVYGLIYYVDSSYDTSTEGSPVTPAYGEDYDFITLTLKVLFENTAVKQFSSYTQLTLNKVFDSSVTGMGDGGNQYNSIIMSGTFQSNNGRPTYGMKTLYDYSFLFNNNVLCAVETLSASMNTVYADSIQTQIRFDLTGYISFLKLIAADDDEDGDTHADQADEGEGTRIDFYSFGPEDNIYTPRTGLNYSNLGLNMSFDTRAPLDHRQITFDSSQLSFNMAASVARVGSLYNSLSMELVGLVSASDDEVTPASLGYLDVVTNIRMGGVSGAWHGLQFRLNLGTAGDLAGKAGLNAYLLLAWSPDSEGESYRTATGLKMPGTNNGAPLISLQSVIALSYGTIQLLYTDKPGEMLHPTSLKPLIPHTSDDGYTTFRSTQHAEASATRSRADSAGKQFMLVLNEIAIKFLGVLKIPPNGSTAFYLFGDADSTTSVAAPKTGLAWYAVYNNEPKTKGDERVRPALLTKGSAGNE